MRYAQVTPFEVCNGKEIGTSIFVQGCSLCCFGCFNQEAWDFSGGKLWDENAKMMFFDAASKHYIKRISILGGEPLARQNAEDVLKLIKEIKEKLPNKRIWLYTGFTFESIFCPVRTDGLDIARDTYLDNRLKVVELCDVLVEGKYVDNLRDVTLAFRGSINQRIIDVKKTLTNGNIILYNC